MISYSEPIIVAIPGRIYPKNSWTGPKGYGRRKKDYERAKEWEYSAREHARTQLIQKGYTLPLFNKKPVKICVTIFIKGKRPDLDNCFKSIFDAMKTVLYSDDYWITRISDTQIFKTDNEDMQQVVISVEAN